MNNKPQNIRPGGVLTGSFNKILACVGLSWFASMIVVRYVIKPWRVDNKMKENESLMNKLYDDEIKQKHESMNNI